MADEGWWQGGQEIQGEQSYISFEIVIFTFLDFQGIREGGVSNNTTFYVFTHGKDGAFEAFPIKDWLVSWIIFLLRTDLFPLLRRYNFTPIQRYKTLDAEEAEERFANRGKVWM